MSAHKLNAHVADTSACGGCQFMHVADCGSMHACMLAGAYAAHICRYVKREGERDSCMHIYIYGSVCFVAVIGGGAGTYQ